MANKSLYFLIFIVTLAINLRLCKGEDNIEDDAPLVRVKQGLIKGIKEISLNGNEFYSYMSIPFAEPPIGNLKFKDPIPKKPWQGVLDGSKMPVYCLQTDFLEQAVEERIINTLRGREDCLHLNVFTKKQNQTEKKLPVMVFIHGGSFIVGGAQEYHPHVLMGRDIILVVIQYRLGIFGFLSTEDSVLPGNMGLKDQQLALKWVKENIEAFGGDPETITIFGQSAGGASVHYQLLCPGSNGLFKRAIIQSGTVFSPWASNRNHRKFAIETGSRFNCSIEHGTELFLECMQDVNPLYLLIAASITNTKFSFTPYYVLPRVDGDFISDDPEILMNEGNYSKVDVMAGITRDEGAFLLLLHHINPTLTKKVNENFKEFGPYSLGLHDQENSVALARKIYQQYLETEDTVVRDYNKKKIVKLYSDNSFKEGHDLTMNFFARDDVNLYLYQLDHVGELSFLDMIPSFDKSDLISHADDLLYLFEGGPYFHKSMKDEENLKLRETMLSLWTNFAQTGNPNLVDFDFTWEKASSSSFRHLSLTPNPQMKNDSFRLERKFWSSLETRRNLNLQRTESNGKTFEK